LRIKQYSIRAKKKYLSINHHQEVGISSTCMDEDEEEEEEEEEKEEEEEAEEVSSGQLIDRMSSS
jgi:hypothetical protein